MELRVRAITKVWNGGRVCCVNYITFLTSTTTDQPHNKRIEEVQTYQETHLAACKRKIITRNAAK